MLWANLENRYVWVVLLVTLGHGIIGFVDDYRKVMQGNSDGLSAKAKLFWQSLIAIAAGIFLYMNAEVATETQFIVPFFKDVMIEMGMGSYVLVAYVVIVGSSNAVNLTDGLDGLAIMPTVMVGAALGIFAYLSGNIKYLSLVS